MVGDCGREGDGVQGGGGGGAVWVGERKGVGADADVKHE